MEDYEQNRLKAGENFAIGAMDAQKSYTEDEIRQDMAFGEAYKNVYKFLNNEDIDDSQENLANSGMQLISDIKNPLYTVDMEDSGGLGLVGSYAKFKDAPKDVKDAVWYMWDRYEEADMTMASFGRAMKSIGKDPSTYTGVGAGLKLFGAKAASSVAMNRFKNMLLSGTASGVYTGGEEFVKQEVQGLEQKDWDSINEMTSIGAVLGVIAPPAIEGLVKGTVAGTKVVGKKIAQTIEEGENLMAQQAGGGKPVYHGTSEVFEDFDVSKSADGSIWFTDDKSKIVSGDVGASSKGVIMERVIDENDLKLGSWDEQDKFSTDELIDQGYDGLRLEEDGEVTYQIFYPEKLKKPKKATSQNISTKFQSDVETQVSKHGNLNELDYSMMDISDRNLTRIQRAKNTIEEIQDDPENAVYTASTFDEFNEYYPGQFKQSKITPQVKGKKVKIYRSATGDIEPGDWIGLDKGYASSHGRTKEHKTYEMWVDKKDIRWQGADANEWIYLPNEIIEADIDFSKGSNK